MKQLKTILFVIASMLAGYGILHAGGWTGRVRSAAGAVRSGAGRAAGAVKTGAKVLVGAGKAAWNREAIKEKITEMNRHIKGILEEVDILKDQAPALLNKNKAVATASVGVLVHQVHQAVSAIIPYIELQPILSEASTICLRSSQIILDTLEINKLSGDLLAATIAKDLPILLKNVSGIIDSFSERFRRLGSVFSGKNNAVILDDIQRALVKNLPERLLLQESSTQAGEITRKTSGVLQEQINISTQLFMDEMAMIGAKFSSQLKEIVDGDIQKIQREKDALLSLVNLFVIAPQPSQLFAHTNNIIVLGALLTMRVAALANTAMFGLFSFKNAFGGAIFPEDAVVEMDGLVQDIKHLAIELKKIVSILPLPSSEFSKQVLQEIEQISNEITPPDISFEPEKRVIPVATKLITPTPTNKFLQKKAVAGRKAVVTKPRRK